MKKDQTKTWQTCAAEIYIAREILKENYEDYEIYELMSGDWQIVYENGNELSIPNLLQVWKGKKLQVFRVPQLFRRGIMEVIDDLIEDRRINESEMNLFGKVWFMLSDWEINDGQPHYEYFDDSVASMFPRDSEVPVIKEKLEAMFVLLAKVYQLDQKEYEKLLDVEVENDVWHFL